MAIGHRGEVCRDALGNGGGGPFLLGGMGHHVFRCFDGRRLLLALWEMVGPMDGTSMGTIGPPCKGVHVAQEKNRSPEKWVGPAGIVVPFWTHFSSFCVGDWGQIFQRHPRCDAIVDACVHLVGGPAHLRFLGNQTQLPMTPRPLFFDLDHTLWDFETNSRLALRLGHEAMGLSGMGVPSVEDWIASYEKANDWCWAEFRAGRMDKATLRAERFRLAFEGLDVSVEAGVCERLGEHYIETSPMQTALMDGALEVLEALKDRGHRMVILTNGFEEVQHIKVDNSGLSGFFSGVYTSDFLGVKKPNPKAFELAAEAAGISMNGGIVMIGDSIESDINGAQSVGWDAVHFNLDGPLYDDAWHSIRHLHELLELPLDM